MSASAMPITGVVLAGGRSRRMGTDKALVDFDGEPLVARAARSLAPVCRDVIVATSAELPLDSVPLPTGTLVLADERPGQGPLGGIAVALEAMTTEWAFVIGVDMPFVVGETARVLWHAGREAPGAFIVMPVSATGPEPLLALYRRDVLPAVREALDAGRRTIVDLVHDVEVLEVPADALRAVDPDLVSLTNLNTHHEMREAMEDTSHPPERRSR